MVVVGVARYSSPVQLKPGVRLKGGDTFNINLCDTDDKYGDVMTVRK